MSLSSFKIVIGQYVNMRKYARLPDIMLLYIGKLYFSLASLSDSIRTKLFIEVCHFIIFASLFV